MARFARRLGISLASISAIILSGCSMTNGVSANGAITSPIGTIRGVAHGGQQPIVGMKIYLYAAGTSAYGAASTSLLTAAANTASDGTNYYVTTDDDGSFSITGDYTCTSGQDIYLYGLGGNTGGSTPNTAAGLMAILGTCPATGTLATQVPYVWMNEVTTVAAAYSFSGFAVDATHVADDETASANTTQTLAQTGMANAFANAANLVDLPSGTALTATPTVGSVGTVPQGNINTIANILASCINSNSATSDACTKLFADATSDGTTSGTPATDTATAAINIAHHPTANVSDLLGLADATAAFSPVASPDPTDFTLTIAFLNGGEGGGFGMVADGLGNVFSSWGSGGRVYRLTPTGLLTSSSIQVARNPTIDISNNVYVAGYGNATSKSVIKRWPNTLGTATTVATTATAGAETGTYCSIAMNAAGNLWAYGTVGTAVLLSPTGTVLATISGLPESPSTGGEIAVTVNPVGDVAFSSGVAVDGSGNPLNEVLIYNSTGTTLLGTATGGGLNGPQNIMSDGSGNFWVANYGAATISEFSSTGTDLSSTGAGYSTGSASESGAFDGQGNLWAGTLTTAGLFELNSAGTQIAATTPPFAQNQYIAVDPSGNVWSTGASNFLEAVGLGSPTVTPIATATVLNKITTRP